MLFLSCRLPLGNQTDSTLEQAHVKFNLAPQDLTYYPWPTLFTTYKWVLSRHTKTTREMGKYQLQMH